MDSVVSAEYIVEPVNEPAFEPAAAPSTEVDSDLAALSLGEDAAATAQPDAEAAEAAEAALGGAESLLAEPDADAAGAQSLLAEADPDA